MGARVVRHLLFLGAASLCMPLLGSTPVRAAARQHVTHLCGMPLPSGPVSEAPRIEMASLPHDDLGWPELILRVHQRGERFCYRYAYNGAVYHRAPIMVVRPGDRFAVRVVNELSGPVRGATLAASALPACKPHSMPEAEPRAFAGYMNHTIEARPMKMSDTDVNMHFHGFMGPAGEENIFLSTLSTPAHACEYAITVPMTQPPGTYLYHPHAHGAADDEVAGGLAGMWIVEPAKPQLPSIDDHAIVLRYRVPFVANWNYIPSMPFGRIAAIREAALPAATPASFDPFDPPPWPSELPLRVGSLQRPRCGSRPDGAFSVDGVDAPGQLTVAANQPQLLRILNATSDSVLYLALHGSGKRDRLMRVVGRDGTPVGSNDARPLSQFVLERHATLAPAARIDLLMTLKDGQTATLYERGHCNGPVDAVSIPKALLVVRAGPPAAHPVDLSTRLEPSAQTPAAKLVAFVRMHPSLVRKRAFTYTEYVLPKAHGKGVHAAYYLTQTSAPGFHEQPFWPVYARGALTPEPSVVVKHGTIEEWYLFNATMETHSFHIHQMNFVAANVPNGPMTLDDVVVPFGHLLPNPRDPGYPLVAPSVTRVILDFRNVPRGTFVFHCHMLFHEDRGMMGVIRVV